MEIDKEKQDLAITEIARMLDTAERERASLRLRAGLKELEKHNFTILFNDEFVERLSLYLCDPGVAEKDIAAMSFLDHIGLGCCNQQQEVRERSLVILTVFCEYALKNELYDCLRKIACILTQWLEIETEYMSGFGVVCAQIRKIGIALLENNFWEEARELLVLLTDIQTNALEKRKTIRGMVAKTLENLAKKEILASLTSVYLDMSDKNQHVAGDLLRYLGRRSAIFLINTLMHSENKEDRFRLMHLIPETGEVIRSVFEECLKKNPPWYVIRNIIFMISERADASFFPLVQPCITHPDMRVQQQLVACILKLGGQEMKERLLMALANVHDELKIPLVMKLGRFGGKDIADALLDLFEERGSFSAKVADELMEMLCLALKSFPYQRTVRDLKRFVEERKRVAKEKDRILPIAIEVLSGIEPRVRHDMKGEVDTLDDLSFDADPVNEQYAKKKMRDVLENIRSTVGKGGLRKVTDMLCAEAERAAKDRDFRVAEMLRDKILEINPAALSEVLEVGEMIEEQRNTEISEHHIEIWSFLYEKMSTDEFNALYSVMKRETYGPNETIVKSGEKDPCLFFINSGTVRLSCICDNKETFLKRLQPGEIIGAGQFFSVSVWTVALVSQNTSQIHVLERERFLALCNQFPDLEKKLKDVCLQYDSVPNLLRMTGNDRREYARYPASISIKSILLDRYRKKEQTTINGKMVDISRGGIAFIARIAKRESAQLLLGRQVVSEIHLVSGEILTCAGCIVGVQFSQTDDQDCSIHVKFNVSIGQSDLTRVTKLVG